MMRQNGLARGGSLDNAVVVGKRIVLNDSLRFADEFVRHKMLDLVGDLAVLGRPVSGTCGRRATPGTRSTISWSSRSRRRARPSAGARVERSRVAARRGRAAETAGREASAPGVAAL